MRDDTSVFLELFVELVRNGYRTEIILHGTSQKNTHRFQAPYGKNEISYVPSGQGRNLQSSLLLNNRNKIHKGPRHYEMNKGKEDFTIGLSPLSRCPVSLKYDICQSPITFATTSITWGMLKCLLMIALERAGREAIQSQFSASVSLLRTHSVIQNGYRLPNKLEAVHCRQRLNNRITRVFYSTNFCRYPLPG